MAWLQVLLIAVGLSMDAVAVALATGASDRTNGARAAFRLSFHFGLFQFLMPIAGWALALSVRGYIEAYDHWIAFGLLWLVGLRMLWEAFRHKEMEERGGADPSRGMALVALSVATSIDALAVGISLAFLDEAILWPSVLIGCTTGALSLGGVWVGRKLGDRLGANMEIIGGLLLLGIGVQIVLSHT